MNKLMLSILMVVIFITAGCSSRAPRFHIPENSTVKGKIIIGQFNYGPMQVAQQQLQQALNSGSESAFIYEQLLMEYGSGEGDFERGILTALSLEYLRQGKIDDFKYSCQRLRNFIDDDVMVTPTMQYILEISHVMSADSYVGRNYDPKIRRVINDILD